MACEEGQTAYRDEGGVRCWFRGGSGRGVRIGRGAGRHATRGLGGGLQHESAARELATGSRGALAGARVIAGSYEHQRRLWLPLGGSPGWTERQRSWVARSVQGKVVTWLEGQGQGGVVPTDAMRDEVARQRRLLGVGQGVVVDDAWLERGVNRGSLLRHAVDISRQLEAANVSWQLDWADWQAAGGQRNTRPYRPPSPFALTPSCSCKAHHIKLDTRAIYGLMRTAGMLPADITSEEKFRSGVAGPKDSETPTCCILVAKLENVFAANKYYKPKLRHS
ncbi:hypothetical protein V8C86DRAFT_2436217 [Haematococcus lacustris]